MTAELGGWHELAIEKAKVLKVSTLDNVLQSKLWEAAREEVNVQTVKTAELQERLAVKSVELSQLSATHGKLSDNSGPVKSQRATSTTVSDVLN